MVSGTSQEEVEKELRKLERAWKRESTDFFQLIEKTVQDLDSLMNVRLNVAITGVSGAGKSSLVNALLGIQDGDKGAAATGVVETTMEAKGYPHHTWPNLIIWDLPGFGSANIPEKMYPQIMNFMKYDFFIIVTSVRFTEADLLLTREIKTMEKRFVFVRTKLDVEIESERRKATAAKESFQEKKILDMIRKNCCDNLQKLGEYLPRVFLVSNFYRNRYDFQHLQDYIEKGMNKIKKSVLITELSNKSKGILKKKKDAMTALVQKIVIVAATSEAASIPDLYLVCNIPFLEEIMREFSKAFGLDKDSLHRLAKQVGKPVHMLSSAVETTRIASQINGEFVRSLLSKMRQNNMINLWNTILYKIGLFYPLSEENCKILTVTLCHFLEDAENDAVNVFAKAFEF